MAKLVKFEEYRAPWETEAGEDAEIDKAKLKKYIHGLLSDKERLQGQVTTLTEERDGLQGKVDEAARKDESDSERQAREAEERKARDEKAKGLESENLRLKVALQKGLSETQAKRLIGTTEEELAADADELVKSFGGQGKGGEEEEGVPSRTPKPLVNPTDPAPGEDTFIDVNKALDSIPRIN